MIYTWSKFNYGQVSALSTQSIPFTEGSSSTVLTAVIPIGGYTLGTYAQAVADAMNTVGTLGYSTSVDRSTNRITIQAPSTFSLLTAQSSTAFPVMGFTQSTTLSGAASYTGNVPSGSQYFPQFLLQSYVPAANNKKAVSATINQSASGDVEVVQFGVNRFIKFELRFISNKPMDGRIIKSNPTGLADALAFLDFATFKNPFEFVPDVANPGFFMNVLLESTDSDSDGTGYELKELYSDNVPDVYDSGLLTLRVIT